ncbi:MAG TPA: CTP synthase, partial [Defluviicoccus sp.]|nr:CTP synthase [Defluviicoccus sp.]
RVLYIHMTLVPHLGAVGELKTKPTQHSVKELLSLGIQPDVLICRADRPLPEGARRKIALFCNVRYEAVVPAEDVQTIYAVPLRYHEQGLDEEVCRHFALNPPSPQLEGWRAIVSRVLKPEGEVTIAIVGKYTGLIDAYKSLVEALTHGGIANNVGVRLDWIDAEQFDNGGGIEQLASADGILIPGGFGERGAQGKIEAARYAREAKIPYFGICFGMQMAVVEAARNLAGIPGAGSTEFGPCPAPVVGLMTEWMRGEFRERRQAGGNLGGTMRLGEFECVLKPNTRARAIFGVDRVSERHRHRYEVNNNYLGTLERCGLVFSGMSPDGLLPEVVEIADHPWFIGVQFHPELKSRPFEPHPLFAAFIRAAIEQSRLV